MSLLNQSNHYSTEKASRKSIFGFDMEMVFPILVVIETHNLKKSPKRVDGINPFFFQNAKGNVQISIKDTGAKFGMCSKLKYSNQKWYNDTKQVLHIAFLLDHLI